MKRISIAIACFNEELNIPELYAKLCAVCDGVTAYEFELLFIDNCSVDGTVAELKKLAALDKRVKIIVNARNFGAVRSGAYLLKQTSGDAVIGLAADLQDPPELIPEFIKKWESGFKIVIGVKTGSDEHSLMFAVRSLYYRLIGGLSQLPLEKQFSGFCLLDKKIVDVIRTIDDPSPYIRGLLCEIGFERGVVSYHQARRTRGISSNNLYSLYDFAMLGITNYSKLPLRLATFAGFVLSALSMCTAIGYLIYKLMFWYSFQLGSAPVVIGLFFFGSVQLFFIGILGEYIGAIYTQVLRRPLVVERERVNFGASPDSDKQ